MPQMEMWYKVNCPDCDKPNWVYYGDPSDMTFFEPENIQCHSCKTCFNMGEDSLNEEIDPDECELGLENPNV